VVGFEEIEVTKTYPQPLVAVDIAAFTVLDADLKVLLIRRGLPPAQLALPGGFVRCGDGSAENQGEDIDDAARRELLEETHLALPRSNVSVHLMQIGVFGAPDRDPRARVISVAHLAVIRPELAAFVRAGSDAAGVMWWSVSEIDRVTLAFDHRQILDRALERLRADVDESAIAAALVPETFTAAEFRAAVEAVRGGKQDPANFRRRVLSLVDEGVVESAVGKRVTGKRPAQVYRFRLP
jgi:8-oxo-dGTP diphosphatase